MINISDEICTENQNMFHVHKIFPKRAFYGIMWKCILRLDVLQITI